ncbi:hypothetical protein C8J56DRAFT_900238 [Mycena floridula]|nr:hypothetical protein C8J56DRAFT_900238 [Mycena floridula]
MCLASCICQFYTSIRRQRTNRTRPHDHWIRAHATPPAVNENVDLEHIPEQLDALAEDVANCARCLNEFPEFMDNACLVSFEGDLKYWASCLQEYQSQFRHPSVQRYLHDLVAEMGSIVTESLGLSRASSRLSQSTAVGSRLWSFRLVWYSPARNDKAHVLPQLQQPTASWVSHGSKLCIVHRVIEFPGGSDMDKTITAVIPRVLYGLLLHRPPFLCLCDSPTILTLITSLGMTSVSAWFVSERWTFHRHHGSKWLSDVLLGSKDHVMVLPGFNSYPDVRHGVKQLSSKTLSMFSKPHVDIVIPIPTPSMSPEPRSLVSAEASGPSVGKQLWLNALRAIKSQKAEVEPFLSRVTTPLQGIGLQTRLRCLQPVQDIPAHQALVRRLQFSADGKFLATSSWDRTCLIFRVEKTGCELHRVLAHARGFAGQVAWSPSGNILLIKVVKGIKIWTKDDVYQRTIERSGTVESIAWLPDNQTFLSVEGSDVIKWVLAEYHFGEMKLRDVAVAPDGIRLPAIGPLLSHATAYNQASLLERNDSSVWLNGEISPYNSSKGCLFNVTSQIPILNDVRDVKLELTLVQHSTPPPIKVANISSETLYQA